jgi:hypothetical protein
MDGHRLPTNRAPLLGVNGGPDLSEPTQGRISRAARGWDGSQSAKSRDLTAFVMAPRSVRAITTVC